MDYGHIKKSDSLRGPATVRLLKTSVQVRFSDDEPGKGMVYTPGRQYEVLRTDAPAVVLPGEFWVALNGKGTLLYAESPIQGDFLFRFAGWRAKPGEVPEPRYDGGGRAVTTKDGRKFTTRPSFSMDAVCVIVDGKYEGLTAMFMQAYSYVADDNGLAVPELGTKAMEALKSWDRCVGLDGESFPYEKNLLPVIGKTILKKARVFQGHVEGGLIRAVSLPPDGYKPPRVSLAKTAKTAAKKTARA